MRISTRMRRASALGLALIGVVVVARPLDAQEASKGSAKEEPIPAQRIEELKRAAGLYRIVAETSPPRELTLYGESVLRWANPLRKTDDGAVFLWTLDGRPQAIASFYRYRRGEELQEDHEFQSLATTGLTASRGGRTVWAPPAAGVAFAPIPGAPGPAATPAARLRQMRDLAHEFHASFDLPKDQTELRLLTRPLYRYEPKDPKAVLDGALFAFVQTTDPEVLLMIEARPAGGKPAWHYAFARMSLVNLKALHKDHVVWKVTWVYQVNLVDQPYITIPAPERPR